MPTFSKTQPTRIALPIISLILSLFFIFFPLLYTLFGGSAFENVILRVLTVLLAAIWGRALASSIPVSAIFTAVYLLSLLRLKQIIKAEPSKVLRPCFSVPLYKGVVDNYETHHSYCRRFSGTATCSFSSTEATTRRGPLWISSTGCGRFLPKTSMAPLTIK